MVAVGIPPTENGVDHIALPGHLQRLESFDPFVGRSHAVADMRLVIVHDHGVDAQDHHIGLLQKEPPQEQPLQEMPEQVNARIPESPEESLDRVGGEHLSGPGLGDAGIARIPGQGVEVHQVPAGTVEEKAEELLEDLADWLSLAVAPDGAEKGLQLRKDLDASEATDEEAQSSSTGEGIRGDLHPINDGFAFRRGCGRFPHYKLPPFGLMVNGIRRLRQPRYTMHLAH